MTKKVCWRMRKKGKNLNMHLLSLPFHFYPKFSLPLSTVFYHTFVTLIIFSLFLQQQHWFTHPFYIWRKSDEERNLENQKRKFVEGWKKNKLNIYVFFLPSHFYPNFLSSFLSAKTYCWSLINIQILCLFFDKKNFAFSL